MSTSNSLGRFTQSKEICIFLVNGDHICRNIVSDMLDHCRYEAFSYDTEMDALDIIREKKDILEIILTNVHRTYADKYGIIEHIKKEFKLQIVLIPPDVDDVKKVGEGGGNGVTVYIVKSLTVNEVKNLLANAMTREKGKREISAGKREKDASEENGKLEKKPRMVWSDEMHLKFVEAIDQLGQDKAFPKKIVELMNVQGLTRENVASHLQKHRMLMKKTQQGFTDFPDPFDFNTFGIRPRNPIPSLLGLNFFESGSRIIPNMPLLSTIQIKPERSFTICSDEKKNVLLSIEDNRVSSNSHFVGFRLASDGKSIKFGQNGCFGIGTWNESYIQEEGFCPEMGNDEYTLRLEREYPASSIAGLLGVDARLTDQQPPPLPPRAATITPPWTTWADWAEPHDFSSQQPPSGNDANVNSEIFNELGSRIDENDDDASEICVFDDLLFDHQDLS